MPDVILEIHNAGCISIGSQFHKKCYYFFEFSIIFFFWNEVHSYFYLMFLCPERTDQKSQRLFDLCRFFSVTFFYSTSLPSGNLVDGLRLVTHTHAAVVYLIRGLRKNVNLTKHLIEIHIFLVFANKCSSTYAKSIYFRFECL